METVVQNNVRANRLEFVNERRYLTWKATENYTDWNLTVDLCDTCREKSFFLYWKAKVLQINEWVRCSAGPAGGFRGKVIRSPKLQGLIL